MLFYLIWVYVAELSFDASCLGEFDWWGGPQPLNKGGRARARHLLILLMQFVIV